MTGLTDLRELLVGMEPVLRDGEFVYASVAGDDPRAVIDPDLIGFFREEEGLTLILPAGVAAARGLAASAAMRMITLTVHSSLEAVGLTAAVAGALAQEGISANVVAAFHHDHIFIPARDADRAIGALKAMSRRAADRETKT